MHSLIIIAGFFFMILLPCAFAVFSSRDPEDSRPAGFKTLRPNRSALAARTANWRIPRPSTFGGDYDLVLQGAPSCPRSKEVIIHPDTVTVPEQVSAPAQHRSPAAQNLLGIAADAEARSVAAQVHAAMAAKDAAAAMARAAAARAAAATALAAEAERAVVEATRMAAAVRRAYETAPASVGPTNHHLPDTHPSMDFPRSHVIRRAA